MKILTGILCLLLCGPAAAINKCRIDGVTSYSDRPCPDGTGRPLALPGNGAAADAKQARDRARRDREALARLEAANERDAREAQKARQQQARVAASRNRTCTALARQRQWREEDAARATLKSAEKAKRLARRAAEKYSAQCGAG